MNNNICAIIPARFGSTRLPGKPLLKINGKSIIQLVYEKIKKSKLISKIIIATDNKQIFNNVQNFGGEVCMTPENCASGTDRIAYVIKKLNLHNFNIIVNVQGDEPMINHLDVENAIKLLQKNNSDVSTLAIKIDNIDEVNNPNSVKVVFDKNFNALYFSRCSIPYHRDSQVVPENFFKHIGVYIFKKDVLMKFNELPGSKLENLEKLEQLRLMENGYKISVALTKNKTIGIDTLEDFEKLKKLIIT